MAGIDRGDRMVVFRIVLMMLFDLFRPHILYRVQRAHYDLGQLRSGRRYRLRLFYVGLFWSGVTVGLMF